MTTPADFHSHALVLVQSPSEVDARRAASAAYYALFHTLARHGALIFGAVGVTHDVARAFDHGTMFKVCRSYLEPALRIDTDRRVVNVAQAFIDLQNGRHQADYDLSSDFDHLEAARLVEICSGALHAWGSLPHLHDDRQAFLVKLLLGTRLNRRG